jgi:hypothetical protein
VGCALLVVLVLVRLLVVLLVRGFLVQMVRGMQGQRAVLMPRKYVGHREAGFSAVAARWWCVYAHMRAVGTCNQRLVNSCINNIVE